jgi:hypothetical protein
MGCVIPTTRDSARAFAKATAAQAVSEHACAEAMEQTAEAWELDGDQAMGARYRSIAGLARQRAAMFESLSQTYQRAAG